MKTRIYIGEGGTKRRVTIRWLGPRRRSETRKLMSSMISDKWMINKRFESPVINLSTPGPTMMFLNEHPK